jgi:hypothetical protein
VVPPLPLSRTRFGTSRYQLMFEPFLMTVGVVVNDPEFTRWNGNAVCSWDDEVGCRDCFLVILKRRRRVFCGCASLNSCSHRHTMRLKGFAIPLTLPDIPSWVPNWAAALDTDNSRFPWLIYLQRADDEPMTCSTAYCASVSSAASMHNCRRNHKPALY